MRYYEIVETDEKSSDQSQYSIPTTDAAYLYHGTSKRNLDNIKYQGLVPRTNVTMRRGRSHATHSLVRIFFADTIANAEFYALRRGGMGANKRKILRVRRDFLPDIQPDKEDDGGFFIERAVPPDQVEFWNGKAWTSLG
jgi:hypothetical protein